MTPTEILHKIVETENDARAIHDEAVALQEGFQEEVRSLAEKLEKQYAEREEKDVSAAAAAAAAKADREIERLDKKLEEDLAAAKKRYEKHREDFVEKIFGLAVNLDA